MSIYTNTEYWPVHSFKKRKNHIFSTFFFKHDDLLFQDLGYIMYINSFKL